MVTYASVSHKVSDWSPDKKKAVMRGRWPLGIYYFLFFILFFGEKTSDEGLCDETCFPILVHRVTILEQRNALFTTPRKRDICRVLIRVGTGDGQGREAHLQ
ncbi:hypothetical protein MCOR25_004523 [Pyricularia grisea]|nr:hypothetical protein MCOR25_004523 [Pyricularia grisea]